VLKDKWLILRFKSGSQDAFCRIFERYRDDLLRLALSLLQDKSSAEDIVHEVFLHLIQVRQEFTLTGSLKAYLATCVANRARNTNRDRRHINPLDSEPARQTMSEDRRPDQWAECSEELECLRHGLMQLPYAQREVVVLRTQGQLTFRQIAVQQDCSIKTAESRYRYALEKLRGLLDGQVNV
jgi:RNA polymerase sigma-70 factor (ECF subfamily)